MVGQTQIAGQTIPVLRFMGFPPNATATGDIEAMDLLAGQSVGLVHEIKPAATIVRDLVDGARKLIEQGLTAILVGRQA
jgi:nitronate monooxygenase